ncbi:MAG: hypothetical protein AB1564_00665 [Chloroflexota bacterium]
MTAPILKLSLEIFLAAMAILALLFLRTRRLSSASYALWGLLAIMVPALGPFLVIAARPGRGGPTSRRGARRRRRVPV